MTGTDDDARSKPAARRKGVGPKLPSNPSDEQKGNDLSITPKEEDVEQRCSTVEIRPRKAWQALVSIALSKALAQRDSDLLDDPSPLALVVSAPATDWVVPLKKYLDQGLVLGRYWTCIA